MRRARCASAFTNTGAWISPLAAVTLSPKYSLLYRLATTLSVVATGKVVANRYSNEYFGLSVTAANGEIQAPVFVNAEAQRARLMDASALLKVHPFRYSMGVLV